MPIKLAAYHNAGANWVDRALGMLRWFNIIFGLEYAKVGWFPFVYSYT